MKRGPAIWQGLALSIRGLVTVSCHFGYRELFVSDNGSYGLAVLEEDRRVVG